MGCLCGAGFGLGRFSMQMHRKIRNVPFPRPYGATGNDAQKLHAPAFAHCRGAVLRHEVFAHFQLNTPQIKPLVSL